MCRARRSMYPLAKACVAGTRPTRVLQGTLTIHAGRAPWGVSLGEGVDLGDGGSAGTGVALAVEPRSMLDVRTVRTWSLGCWSLPLLEVYHSIYTWYYHSYTTASQPASRVPSTAYRGSMGGGDMSVCVGASSLHGAWPGAFHASQHLGVLGEELLRRQCPCQCRAVSSPSHRGLTG